MARRYSTIKKIEKTINTAEALPAANNTVGDKKAFVGFFDETPHYFNKKD